MRVPVCLMVSCLIILLLGAMTVVLTDSKQMEVKNETLDYVCFSVNDL